MSNREIPSDEFHLLDLEPGRSDSKGGERIIAQRLTESLGELRIEPGSIHLQERSPGAGGPAPRRFVWR